MKTLRNVAAVATVLALAGSLARPAAAGDRADKREIIKQAKAAYYSLRQKGLDSFQVTVAVNWDLMLGDVSPERKANTMRLLNGLHFAAAFDAAGKTTITHRADVPAPTEQAQRGYDQIFTGIDQVLTGFMDTYKPFMVGSPFPGVSADYVLEDADNGYRLSYKEDATTDIVTRMTKTFAIIETKIHTPEWDSTVRPTFMTTPEGYVLAGYDGDYVPANGAKGVVKLNGKIEHGEVEGLQLPVRLTFSSATDGTPMRAELTFTEYTVKKK
jgi:hypothetical protein